MIIKNIIIIIIRLIIIIKCYNLFGFIFSNFPFSAAAAVTASARVRVLTVHRVPVALLAAAEALSMGQQERIQGGVSVRIPQIPLWTRRRTGDPQTPVSPVCERARSRGARMDVSRGLGGPGPDRSASCVSAWGLSADAWRGAGVAAEERAAAGDFQFLRLQSVAAVSILTDGGRREGRRDQTGGGTRS